MLLFNKYPEQAPPEPSLLIDHIDYIVKLVWPDCRSGSDFDGMEFAPVGLDGVEDFANH